MKNLCWVILFFFFFFFRQEANAQKNQFVQDSLVKRYAEPVEPAFNLQRPYYITVFNSAISSSVKVIRRLDAQVAIIEVDSKKALDSLKAAGKIAIANHTWKLSPSLEKTIQRKDANEKYILTGQSIDALLPVLQGMKKDLAILSVNKPTHSVIVKCSPAFLQKNLIGLKEVIFIDIVAEANAEIGIIGYDRSFHGINAVDYLIPGANGKGIVAGVKEQKMDESDIDLWKRVLPSSISAPTTSYHATVVASIIGGAGNSFYDGRGIAWSCNFFPSSFSNLFADDAAILNANKVTVQNHSYGTIIQQFYGAEAVSYDVVTWNNKNFVPVISAGNQGESWASEGKYASLPGFANLTGNFKMAKNVISVAAIDNKENIPSLSSAGPLYDGRTAPQLTALGPAGTSDAAAIVSGTVAVMQQVFLDSNNILPPASLIKAILYNTADDIYKTGIDYKTGYGLLNSYESIKAIQQQKWDGGTLSQGQIWTKNFAVPVNAAELKVTLAWTDSAAKVNNNKALINDLDLEVVNLANGTIYQPWVLNTSAHIDSLGKASTRKRDSLNTAEQVSISLPTAGNYEVRVKSFVSGSTSIPFHIAFKTDTLNTFHFTSPQHVSDVNRQENETLSIRWKTFVADTAQTGNLFISFNNGTTWQLLQQSVKLKSGKYAWQIKDTASVAQLKMETGFGNFLSNAFIITKITRPQVDFSCTDSFRLSWNKHIYASAYRVFAFTDNPYLIPILTVTDTFVVLRRTVYPSKVYAIEPVLSNGLPAARSIALNIDQQGVQCFYRTLNYNLLDNNKLKLLLELSVASYADSIYFEKVSSSGDLLQTYGGQQAANTNLVYTVLVDEVQPGITYLRGRIKLKNGSVVYTEIIPVLTSGSKYIWFYPNPVIGNTVLKYVLQQGVPTSSQLFFFDVTGRLLKTYSSMPGQVDLTGFPKGLVIFKLVDDQFKTLETGKLVIH